MDKRSVFFAVPFYREPKCAPFISSLERAVKLFKDSGYETHAGVLCGDSYVQRARSILVKQFLDTDCETLIFLDDDMSWEPEDLLRLVNTHGSIVASFYRLKENPEVIAYSDGINKDDHGFPILRDDGCVSAWGIPLGFTKIERNVFEKLIANYPEQEYYGKIGGLKTDIYYDLFPQGVYSHNATSKQWLGEDFAFCRLWTNMGGDIWVMPDVNIVHYSNKDSYPGNYHEYLLSLPGGINYVDEGIDGWTKNEELAVLRELASKSNAVVEIGSWKGRSTKELLESCKGNVYAVDHWKGTDNDMTGVMALEMDIYKEFLNNVGHYSNLIVLKGNSVDMADQFDGNRADMVFIDADHSYEGCKSDIEAWMPKCNKIMCGHDYNNDFPSVIQAVDEKFDKINLCGSLWWVEL